MELGERKAKVSVAMVQHWKGAFFLDKSIGVYHGHVGDNKPHQHWASQITIAINGVGEGEVGLEEQMPNTYWQQIIWPFKK